MKAKLGQSLAPHCLFCPSRIEAEVDVVELHDSDISDDTLNKIVDGDIDVTGVAAVPQDDADAFEAAGVRPEARAEELSLADWRRLTAAAAHP